MWTFHHRDRSAMGKSQRSCYLLQHFRGLPIEPPPFDSFRRLSAGASVSAIPRHSRMELSGAKQRSFQSTPKVSPLGTVTSLVSELWIDVTRLTRKIHES